MELENAGNIGGIAKAGLTTGIIGSTLGALNTLGNGGLLGGLLGGGGGGWGGMMPYGAVPYAVSATPVIGGFGCGCGCSEDHTATRYDIGTTKELMAKDLQISELNTAIKLRDANIYTDQKSIELFRYIDGQLNGINAQLAAQAVNNQATKDSLHIIDNKIDCVRSELDTKICCESKERKCADGTLVNYMNATFYPKLVSDITTGTTTTAQTLYNPLPVDNCCCGC